MATDRILEVEIITPKAVLFSGKAKSVSLPGSYSPFQVLYNHAPIVSSLDEGSVKLVDENDKDMIFASAKGMAEVRDNKVSILVEMAESVNDFTKDSINSDMEKAKQKLAKCNNDDDKAIILKDIKWLENKLKIISK